MTTALESLIDCVAERVYNDRHTGTWADLLKSNDVSKIQKYRNVANSAILAMGDACVRKEQDVGVAATVIEENGSTSLTNSSEISVVDEGMLLGLMIEAQKFPYAATIPERLEAALMAIRPYLRTTEPVSIKVSLQRCAEAVRINGDHYSSYDVAKAVLDAARVKYVL